jgi:hypothetical protein
MPAPWHDARPRACEPREFRSTLRRLVPPNFARSASFRAWVRPNSLAPSNLLGTQGDH